MIQYLKMESKTALLIARYMVSLSHHWSSLLGNLRTRVVSVCTHVYTVGIMQSKYFIVIPNVWIKQYGEQESSKRTAGNNTC